MVGARRFELPTSRTRTERSTKLSHAPTLHANLDLGTTSFGERSVKASQWEYNSILRERLSTFSRSISLQQR